MSVLANSWCHQAEDVIGFLFLLINMHKYANMKNGEDKGKDGKKRN